MSPGAAPHDSVTLEVIELIGQVVVRFHEEYEEAAGRHGLTGAQARLLALLAVSPTPMRRLAHRLGCEPSNVTGIVDRLENRGLVERRADPSDRRVKIAAATGEGLRVNEELRASMGFAAAPLASLSRPERAVLRDLLRRMVPPRPDPS